MPAARRGEKVSNKELALRGVARRVNTHPAALEPPFEGWEPISVVLLGNGAGRPLKHLAGICQIWALSITD